MIAVKNVQSLRRQAAQWAGAWFAVEREVYTAERERVALAKDPGTAAYLVAIHNAFLPVVNALLQVRKALRDRDAMTKLLKERAR